MNSMPNPKQTDPHDVAVAALKQAYEQIERPAEMGDKVRVRMLVVSALHKPSSAHWQIFLSLAGGNELPDHENDRTRNLRSGGPIYEFSSVVSISSIT